MNAKIKMYGSHIEDLRENPIEILKWGSGKISVLN